MRRPPHLAAAVLALVALLAAPRGARAADAPDAPPTDRLTLATERVVVFKDGYALFVKTGTATADAAGTVHTDAVPDGAVLGCFWATSPDAPVRALRARWVETERPGETVVEATSVADLLRANVGRVVTLGLARERDPDVLGTVVGLLDRPVAAPPRPAGALVHGPARTEVGPAEPRTTATHVLVDVAGVRAALPVGEVRTVTGRDLLTTYREKTVERTVGKRLTVELGPERAGRAVRVSLLYFTEGVRWIPTYRVGGDLETSASLELTGEVVNDAEDVTGAALDLVVGVPSFRFKDTVSPLALEAALAGAAAAQARSFGSRRSDALRGQMAMTSNSFRNDVDSGGGGGPVDGAIAAAPELATDRLQDLFLYSLPSVSLRRGERAALSLWSNVVPVAHVYTTEIAVKRHPRGGQMAARSGREADLGTDRDTAGVGASGRVPVWHELELRNPSNVPWTTGAALVTRGPLPIGQNLLGYTSPGVTTRLPLTVAVDVAARWDEEEVDRTPRAVTFGSDVLARVRKKGTVTVANRRGAPSPVRVALSLGGRVESASDGGKVVLNEARRDDWEEWPWWWWGLVAGHSDVTWEATLAAGETKTFTVEVTFPSP